ncbi:MAG: hypothetical protein IPO09_11680 [Anaeromyxobacter sp.]|nr:hypothetical protein [Anaeromyxobacter sp.]MBL0276252.1 hypothetical protein [Anaeromyxobacter sp.]
MHEADITALMALLLLRTLTPRRQIDVTPITAPVVAVELDHNAGETTVGIKLAVEINGTALVHTELVLGASVSVTSLTAAIARFLEQVGVTVPVKRKIGRVFLVAQDTKAVLGLIENVTRDTRIRQLGEDVHHADFMPVQVGTGRWVLSLIDLRAFFQDRDIENVADFIGFASVEAVSHQLAGQLGRDAAQRLATEGRGVAVISLAFKQFRDRMLSRWGADPLRNRTLASLAARVFRGSFLKSGPAPWKRRLSVKKRKTTSGFRDERRNEKVFAGNPDVRLSAARALWGGLMIAFQRGFVVRPLVELDTISLYPHAAIIQALPYQRTRWRALRGLGEIEQVEGFATVEFEFPPDCAYPNLPTVRDGVHRMHFTRRGVSTCTVAELQVAVRLGARIQIISSQVFEPGERERQHDPGAYMRVLLADKASAPKGSIQYEMSKLLVNALIGKLVERFGGSTLLDFERTAQLQGFAAGLGSTVANSSTLHQALKRNLDAGSMFAPEWAALIIGRGRAIMGDACAKGQVALVSTDAVLVAPGTDLSCPGLDALRAVGSDLRLEHTADAAFIARNRCYALLRRPENITEKDDVLASNSKWAVIRTARHGPSETPVEFAETVLACIAAGRDVAPARVRERRIGAHEAVRLGRRINEEVSEPHRTTFSWDGKRRLLNRDVNIFTDATATAPYETLGAMEGAERQAQRSKSKRERVTSREQAKKLRAVMALLADGLTVAEVAREVGVELNVVEEIRRRMPVGSRGAP